MIYAFFGFDNVMDLVVQRKTGIKGYELRDTGYELRENNPKFLKNPLKNNIFNKLLNS